jgi:hypothetical protein
MNILRSNKGIVLMMTLAFLALFTTATVLYITAIVSDFKLTKRSTNSYKAFFLAESGIYKALYGIRNIPGYPGEGASPIYYHGLNKGEYEVSVSGTGPILVESTGYFPRKSGQYVKKSVVAEVSAPMPAWFFGNAIFAGENVDLNGNYTITPAGSIRYGDVIDPEGLGQKFDGDFPMLDFEQLRNTAIAQVKPNGQNNLYTATDIANNKPFPDSFWFDADNDPPTIPNVVYVETNLVLKGNVGTLCGFFVVAGDVITNPSSDGADTTINGNGTIDGCVYTLGDFRINGGGNGLGVTGGVWGRDEVRLNGNGEVTYGQPYQDAIRALDIGVKPQIISWREKY